MSFVDQPAARDSSIPYINDLFLAEESALVNELADAADPGDAARQKIQSTAAQLVRAVRKNAKTDGGIEAFLQQYDLSSAEGVLLMCIAEALLRIPDADTADRLIADKITSAQWKEHLGESDSLFVNASTWGLMLTGQILTLDETAKSNPGKLLGNLVSRAGEPVVRTAMRQAMKIMGHQFVMGRTIGEALKRATKKRDPAVSALVRHAWRIGIDDRRCRALPRELPRRHQGDRGEYRNTGARCICGTRYFRQTFCIASAL